MPNIQSDNLTEPEDFAQAREELKRKQESARANRLRVSEQTADPTDAGLVSGLVPGAVRAEEGEDIKDEQDEKRVSGRLNRMIASRQKAKQAAQIAGKATTAVKIIKWFYSPKKLIIIGALVLIALALIGFGVFMLIASQQQFFS